MQSKQDYKNDINKYIESIHHNEQYTTMQEYNDLIDNKELITTGTIEYIDKSEGKITLEESFRLLKQMDKCVVPSRFATLIENLQKENSSLKIDESLLKNNEKKFTYEHLDEIASQIEATYNQLDGAEKEKLANSLTQDISKEYKIACKSIQWKEASTAAIIFNETVELKDEFIPDKSSYYSYYQDPTPLLVNHPYDKDIDSLLSDPELQSNQVLMDTLKRDKELLVGQESTQKGEPYGIDSQDLFEKKYQEYATNNNIKALNKGELSKSTQSLETMTDLLKNNRAPKAPLYDEATIDKLVELSEFALKNGMFEMSNDPINNPPSISYYLNGASRKLAESIKTKNQDDIIKYTKETEKRVENSKYMIDELKKLNPNGFINSNQSDDRSPTYPGYFRNDVVGSTLFRTLEIVNRVAKENNISLKEFLNDPEKGIEKISNYKMATTGYNQALKDETPFKGMYNMLNQYSSIDDDKFFDLQDSATMNFDGDFSRFQDNLCRAFSNENGFAVYNNLNMMCTYTNHFAAHNSEVINQYLHTMNDNQQLKLKTEIFPAMVLLGKDFDIYEHSPVNDQLVDFQTGEFKKPFDLKEYAKENLTAEELVNKLIETKAQGDKFLEDTKDDLTAVDNLTKEDVFERRKDSNDIMIFSLKEKVSEIIKEKTKINDKNIDKYLDKIANGQKLTPMQKNTLDGLCTSSKCISELDQTKDCKEAINSIAEMQKKYDSHNGLAKLFYPNLRAQKKVLDELKTSLSEKGIDKKEIDNAIKLINGKDKDKEAKFNSLIDKLNKDSGFEKEEVSQVTEHNEINKAQEEKVIDPVIEEKTKDIRSKINDEIHQDKTKNVVKEDKGKSISKEPQIESNTK